MAALSKILISFPPDAPAIDRLRREHPGCEIRIEPNRDKDGGLPPEALRGADAALVELIPANFSDFDRLRFLQLASVGFEQLEKFPVLERGIRASNARGVFDPAIAEWVLMMMLLWHRRMPEMMENQRQARWDRGPRFQNELRGSTVGLYGYGGIARETARLAKALGMRVWVCTRDGAVKPRGPVYGVAGVGDPEGVLPDRAFSARDRSDFFAGIDYLVLTIPLTPASRGVISEDDLRTLRPTAVLINPARAGLVEEALLLRALREKWIRGAALDVHYAYPLPPEHPLWRMPEVILTPHISGSSGTAAYPARLYDLFAQNLRRLVANEPLLNELSERDVRGG